MSGRTRLSLNYTLGFNNSYETSVMLMGYLREERSVVVDVFQDDLKLDETLDARGSAVLVLGVDVGRPLRVSVGKVPVELLDDPDLSRLLVDAEVRRDLEQESNV